MKILGRMAAAAESECVGVVVFAVDTAIARDPESHTVWHALRSRGWSLKELTPSVVPDATQRLWRTVMRRT